MVNNYGAFSELPKSAPTGYNYGAYSERMPTAYVAPIKSRTNYKDRAKQAKAYKPTGVVFQGPASTRTSSNFTYGAGNPVTKNPKTNEYRAGERGQGKMKATKSTFTYSAPSTSKPKAAKKDTSFAKSGLAGVLKSPEAKKFRKAFAKKGLIPALRGK